jgi:exosortase
MLIPLVTIYFVFQGRRKILQAEKQPCAFGLALLFGGLLLYAIALWKKGWLGENDFASMTIGGAVVVFWGSVLFAFGKRTFAAARFPMLFLVFAIPAPLFLLDGFIDILQVGSTEVTQRLFDLTGTVYYRDGFTYHLGNISIEVARECSGIRSTLALIITGVLAGHLFLRSGWQTAVLLVAMLPITIIKNGIRILTLSLLAIHVDTKYITESALHHSGGFLFYLPALAGMGLVIWALRKAGKVDQKRGKRVASLAVEEHGSRTTD